MEVGEVLVLNTEPGPPHAEWEQTAKLKIVASEDIYQYSASHQTQEAGKSLRVNKEGTDPWGCVVAEDQKNVLSQLHKTVRTRTLQMEVFRSFLQSHWKLFLKIQIWLKFFCSQFLNTLIILVRNPEWQSKKVRIKLMLNMRLNVQEAMSPNYPYSSMQPKILVTSGKILHFATGVISWVFGINEKQSSSFFRTSLPRHPDTSMIHVWQYITQPLSIVFVS